MLISVIPIGNSKGVRLPKTIIEQLNISDKLDMEIKDQNIILKPVKEKSRKGWSNSFAQMYQNSEDTLDDDGKIEAFEWEW